MSNDLQGGTGETQAEVSQATPARPARGPGSGAWMGSALALMMGMRTLVPMVQNASPGMRHLVLALAVGAAPVSLGVHAWRRREERKATALRAERARARLARSGRAAGR